VTGESQSSNTRDKIAVALAVDDSELRARVLRALNGCTDRFVVADDSKGADVLLTDAIATRRPLPPELPVILIGGAGTLYDAMQRGYAGSLLPSFADRKLQIAIEAAAHGLICTEAHGESSSLVDEEGEGPATAPELTLREVEVLQQLITGASNKEIARRLNISIHTAKFHVASIVAKLGASGRTDAVARAIRLARSMI
jgi:DNA-binding CsgD family transcriptional regulator